jgi:hypothetical protein
MSTVATVPSLWSAEIRPGIQSPWAVLNAQAEALEKQTNGILVGFLGREELGGQKVRLWLDIVVPELNDYHHRVLVANYSEENLENLYPVELDAEVLRRNKQLSSPYSANSEKELNEVVAQVLTSERVVAAAQSLIAKVTDARIKKEQAAKKVAGSRGTKPANGAASAEATPS